MVAGTGNIVSPEPTARNKYSNKGAFSSEMFSNWDIDEELQNILADRANKGLSDNTWKQYKCVFNHIKRCEKHLGKSMQLPFDLEKTLNFIGYLIDERNCSASTINSYLSALRMAHLTQGMDCPHLRQPIVDLILKGQAHHDSLKETIDRKASRLPVTIPILRYLKHTIMKMKWPLWRKYRLWAAACLLWNGGMRVHEGLAKEKTKFDPTSTLLLQDIEFYKSKINGKNEELLKVKLKCPKESSIGNGVVIEIFANKTFFCPVSAMKKYIELFPAKLEQEKPLFRTETGANFTGRDLNKELSDLTKDITDGTTGVIRSHSFRSGLATEMGLAGFSDNQIMAAGRWSSLAFKAYCKLPRSKRMISQRELVQKVMKNRAK